MTGFHPDKHISNKKEQSINPAPDLEERYEHFLSNIEDEQLFLHQLDLKNLLSVLNDGILSYSRLVDKLSGGEEHYKKDHMRDGPQYQEKTRINTYDFISDLKMVEGLKIGDRFRFESGMDPRSIFSKTEREKISLKNYEPVPEFYSLINGNEEQLEKFSEKYEVDINKLKLSISVLPIFLNKISVLSGGHELQVNNEIEIDNLKKYVQVIKEQYEEFNPRFRYFMDKVLPRLSKEETGSYTKKYEELLDSYFGLNMVSATPPQELKARYDLWKTKDEKISMKNYGQVQIFFDEPIKERVNPLDSIPGRSLPADHRDEFDVGIAGAITPRHFHAIGLGDYDIDNNVLYLPKNRRVHPGENKITDEYVNALVSELISFQDKGVLIMDREKHTPIDIRKVSIKIKEDYYQKGSDKA